MQFNCGFYYYYYLNRLADDPLFNAAKTGVIGSELDRVIEEAERDARIAKQAEEMKPQKDRSKEEELASPMDRRGAYGETILHIACLYGNFPTGTLALCLPFFSKILTLF